jgi:hypothetical protein
MDRSEFCGTIVSAKGIHLASEKLTNLFETAYPPKVKQVQSFLGVCNRLRDFIPTFALVFVEVTKLVYFYDHILIIYVEVTKLVYF